MNARRASAIPSTRARGRPRSERSQKAILKAAAQLLRTQGLRAMTIEGVAERAGVSKATIYRWWPSKGVLALDAFYAEWTAAQGLEPNTGTLRSDLRSRLRAVARLMASERLGPALADLVAEAQSDPDLAEYSLEHVQEPLRDQTRAIFARAVERGEIPPTTDVEAAIDLLIGPLFLRLLNKHGPLTPRFADTIVELVLAGLTPPRRRR